MEVLLTGGLVSVVLGAASGAQNIGPLAAIAAGAYIALAGLWAGPVSGASMNPARSFGPALVGGDLGTYWIYVIGPIVGSWLAVAVSALLRGPGGGRTAERAAQGQNPETQIIPHMGRRDGPIDYRGLRRCGRMQ